MHGGNRQSDHTRKGFENFVALMQHSYNRGVTFFDLADLYGSHVYFREALKTIPRDKVSILTKMWTRYDETGTPDAPDYCKQIAKTTLDRFCHEIATDHLDIVLLHCMMTPNWTDQLSPYMEALDDAKKRGQVRAVGVSCHDLQAVVTAASSPWVDVILARINPFGAKMDGKLEEVVPVLTKARQNGKAIIGMKIYGEGTLVDKKDTMHPVRSGKRFTRRDDSWCRDTRADGRNTATDRKVSRDETHSLRCGVCWNSSFSLPKGMLKRVLQLMTTVSYGANNSRPGLAR